VTPFASELVSICRHFGVFERDAVCCGTVTVPQCIVMQQLLDAEREVSALASSVGVTVSAMTRMVDGLTARRFVERGRGEDDKRRVTVRLTRAGRTEAERLRGLTEGAIGAVFSRIPGDKHASVVEALRLLRTAIEGARADLEACCAPAPERD
jgi:DNA-binding MarR family transcriptional regulator